MGQPACLEKPHYNQTFAIVPRSCITRRRPCVNTLVDPAGELNKLAGAQSQAKRSNAGSNEASTKAFTLPETPTLFLVPLTSKDFFSKFMKMFIKTT